jgi:hypothetical protein
LEFNQELQHLEQLKVAGLFHKIDELISQNLDSEKFNNLEKIEFLEFYFSLFKNNSNNQKQIEFGSSAEGWIKKQKYLLKLLEEEKKYKKLIYLIEEILENEKVEYFCIGTLLEKLMHSYFRIGEIETGKKCLENYFHYLIERKNVFKCNQILSGQLKIFLYGESQSVINLKILSLQGAIEEIRSILSKKIEKKQMDDLTRNFIIGNPSFFSEIPEAQYLILHEQVKLNETQLDQSYNIQILSALLESILKFPYYALFYDLLILHIERSSNKKLEVKLFPELGLILELEKLEGKDLGNFSKIEEYKKNSNQIAQTVLISENTETNHTKKMRDKMSMQKNLSELEKIVRDIKVLQHLGRFEDAFKKILELKKIDPNNEVVKKNTGTKMPLRHSNTFIFKNLLIETGGRNDETVIPDKKPRLFSSLPMFDQIINFILAKEFKFALKLISDFKSESITLVEKKQLDFLELYVTSKLNRKDFDQAIEQLLKSIDPDLELLQKILRL